MLKSGPYTIVTKDPSTNYLKEVKHNVKNSVLLSDQTKPIVIPSIANYARFYTFLKIHKPAFAFHPLFVTSTLLLINCSFPIAVSSSLDLQ